MPSQLRGVPHPTWSTPAAAGVGVVSGLLFALVSGVLLAYPGEVVNPLVAVGCFLVAAPPAFVLARAPPGERAVRFVGYLAVWLVAALVGVGVLYAWFLSMPGMQGVGVGSLLLFVGPGAFVAAAVALRVRPRRLAGFGGVTVAFTAVGLVAGHALESPLETYWLPEAGFGAGLVVGLAVAFVLLDRTEPGNRSGR